MMQAGRSFKERQPAGSLTTATPRWCYPARYARARAWAGAFADADAAWQRGAEFATRARLFTDIAGWLSCQVRLRYRYGPTDLAEIGDMRQMIKLRSEQPSERVVPMAGSARKSSTPCAGVTKSSTRRRWLPSDCVSSR
jgi:hypothetical protein